jgi:hypothetical protein
MYYCIFRKDLPNELIAYPTTVAQFNNEWTAAISTLDGATSADYIIADYDGDLPKGMILFLDDDGIVNVKPNPKVAARMQAKSEIRAALNKLGLSNDTIDRAGVGL